ncbi:Arginase/deacetylase [Jackrogersella minutella]|nr:Arginase/deacetylase [Jackrogersella minutella]
MAFPERSRARSRLEEEPKSDHNEEHELLQSLNKLSLSTSPSNSNSNSFTKQLSTSPISNSNSIHHNYNHNHNHTSARFSSVSPSTRTSSRSPLNRSTSHRTASPSRSITPSLLRKTSASSLRSSSGITPSRAPSRRGSSTNLLSPSVISRSPLIGPTYTMEESKEKSTRTAASVASAYMQKELEVLHSDTTKHQSETIVVLHDACYGHRFSRHLPARGNLNDIVERPERIQASVLGLSLAYIRLGERHVGGRHPIYPELNPTSIDNVPFHIRKTQRTLPLNSIAVTNVHGTKWMEELKIMCDSAQGKLTSKQSEVGRPEMNRGQAGPPEELHSGDLYLCSESLNAFEGALGAVCEAVDEVLGDSHHKRAFVAVRPPGHHCSSSYPSGFCWINNVHVGIMHGFLKHSLTHAAIIDFDLHHGDGSQSIAWDHNKRSKQSARNAALWKRTSIGYFSLHDINSYPCENGDEDKIRNASVCLESAHGQSMWNVHLKEWKTEVEFWTLYQSTYSILLEKARSYLRAETERFRASGQEPKAAIFLSAGFDASEHEGAGMQRHKVNVPTGFYARLTRDVVKLASEEGLGVDSRIISVLEGGYSDRALSSGVFSHLSGLAGTGPIPPKEEASSGHGYDASSMVGSVSRRNTLTGSAMKLKTPEFPYDPTWWSASELDRLDAAMGAQPPEQPRKPRSFVPGNYSTPTQSSYAKAVDPTKIRRTMSGAPSQASVSRTPSPPPPDVPWAVAAHELSKLLIPTNRQTNSFRAEELCAVSTKTKRGHRSSSQSNPAGESSAGDDPASTVAAPTSNTRKSLRERKPISYSELSDPSRRKTVGGPTGLATEKASARGIPVPKASELTQHIGDTSLKINGSVSPTQRPSTAQSVRPESSMSSRTQSSNGLNVKKTRPAARGPKKTRAPTAKPKKTSSPTKNKSTINSSEGSPSPDSKALNKGMDGTIIDPAGKEGKSVQADEADKTKVENEERATDNERNIGIHAESGSDVPDAEQSSSTSVPTILAPVEANQTSSPFSSPVQATPEAAKNDSTFIEYQPEGPPPATLPATNPIHFHEPFTSMAPPNGGVRPFGASSLPATPTRKGGHEFTPLSSIPFAEQPMQENPPKSKDNASALATPKRKADTRDDSV